MKFDAVIGNPPFQIMNGGHATSSTPIYQYFVYAAKNLDPQKITMIIPARWYTGQRSMKFRQCMITDKCITTIVDVVDSRECFDGVKVNGGICYFLRENIETDGCAILTLEDGLLKTSEPRKLDQFDIFIRNSAVIPIIKKVLEKTDNCIDQQVLPKKPFMFRTNFKDFKDSPANMRDPIEIYLRGRKGWIERDTVFKNAALVDKFKVLLSASYGVGETFHPVTSKPFLTPPGSCCTETFLVVGSFDNRKSAENLIEYMRTKFFRFMLSIVKNTQHISRDRFKFVPEVDLSVVWTDAMLYDLFKLSPQEKEFIEGRVRKWQ